MGGGNPAPRVAVVLGFGFLGGDDAIPIRIELMSMLGGPSTLVRCALLFLKCLLNYISEYLLFLVMLFLTTPNTPLGLCFCYHALHSFLQLLLQLGLLMSTFLPFFTMCHFIKCMCHFMDNGCLGRDRGAARMCELLHAFGLRHDGDWYDVVCDGGAFGYNLKLLHHPVGARVGG